MEAPSIAISPLGLVVDLIWNRVFMCMHRRMMAQSGGASTCWTGAGRWMDGRGNTTVARSLRCARERESNGCGRQSNGGRRRGMGSTPTRVVLFIGRSQRIYPLRLLPPYKTPQRLYSEKLARKSRRNFR
jgi:hypothetical protein